MSEFVASIGVVSGKSAPAPAVDTEWTLLDPTLPLLALTLRPPVPPTPGPWEKYPGPAACALPCTTGLGVGLADLLAASVAAMNDADLGSAPLLAPPPPGGRSRCGEPTTEAGELSTCDTRRASSRSPASFLPTPSA